MKQTDHSSHYGIVKAFFNIFCLILFLVTFLSSKAAAAIGDEADKIRINVDGTLSVDIVDRSIKSVLGEISDISGIRILLYGIEDVPISRHFENMPLERGLRNLLGKRSVSFLYQADPSNAEKGSQTLKIVWVFDSIGSGLSSVAPEPQKAAFDEMDPMDREVREEDEAEHMTLARPKIKLNYDLNSEEGFWVDRIMNAPDIKEKEEAIAELVNLDTDSAIAAISVAFDAKDPGLRMKAVDNLAKSKNPLSDQLIGQAFLKDEDTQVAIKAAHVLHNRDSLVAAEFLTEIYKGHKNEAVLKAVLKMFEPESADKIDKLNLPKNSEEYSIFNTGSTQ